MFAKTLESRLREVVIPASDEVIDALVALGFDETSLGALDLVPLVFMAWADGRVCRAERAHIETLAAARRLSEAAARKLGQLLDFPTDDDTYLRRCLRVLARMYGVRPPAEGARLKRDLIEAVTQVMGVARNKLGLRRRTPTWEQRALLETVVEGLKITPLERRQAEREELITRDSEIIDLAMLLELTTVHSDTDDEPRG